MNKAGGLNLRRFASKFSLEKGTLFRYVKGRKLVVVHTMKQALQLFQQYHDSPQGGHQGIVKTTLTMNKIYYWPGMTKDSADWVSQCLCCRKVGKELNLDTTLKSIKVTQLFGLVGIDLMGPLPATKKGYQYIMTATVSLTRWFHAFPIKNKSASVMAKKMYKFIQQYGCPQHILTDCGSEFNNEPTDLEQFDEEYYKDYIMKNEGSRDAETKVAITNISNAQEKQQIQYAKTKTRKHGEITFKVDDTVLLLNVRRKTRKGGQQDPTYVGPYKIAAVEGKRVKLENKLGKGLATLYSISQLKVFKEPPKLGEENISQRNIEKETAVDDTVKTSEVGEMGGNVSHKPHNSQVEVTHREKEECVVSGVSSSHPGDFDDMVMEDDEEREWFLKGIAYHTSAFKRFC